MRRATASSFAARIIISEGTHPQWAPPSQQLSFEADDVEAGLGDPAGNLFAAGPHSDHYYVQGFDCLVGLTRKAGTRWQLRSFQLFRWW
jgi:hypothetical protein